MVIPDSRTIVFGTAAQQTRYRYCPIPSLPSSFKDADEMVPDTPPFEERRPARISAFSDLDQAAFTAAASYVPP